MRRFRVLMARAWSVILQRMAVDIVLKIKRECGTYPEPYRIG